MFISVRVSKQGKLCLLFINRSGMDECTCEENAEDVEGDTKPADFTDAEDLLIADEWRHSTRPLQH